MFYLIRVLVLLANVFLSTGLYAAEPLTSQSSVASGVTIKVTPQNLQGSVWEFEVILDTHSQDLNDDLVKNVSLIKSDGTQVAPVAWQGDAPGGHHRKGILRFDAIGPLPSMLELRIARAGERNPRSFRWDLK